MLRAFLRQDPDIIMVGEIRDLETAEIAIKAAQTGHLVLSTLHTNDRPEDSDAPRRHGRQAVRHCASVSLIIAQRLAPRLCSNCKEPVDVPAEALLKEGFTGRGPSGLTIYHAKGCNQCTGGYKGRVGILSGHAVHRGDRPHHHGRRQRDADRAQPPRECGLEGGGLKKVKDGLTSLEEINRVTVEKRPARPTDRSRIPVGRP